MSNGKVLLETSSISHSFEYPLFENINLTLKEQESISIVGVSGSGKSTLLHILASFLKPNSGNVNILGKDIYSLEESKLIDIRKDIIGIIFQQHYLFKGFNVLENLKIGSFITDKEIDFELLEKLRLTKVLNTNISDISGGEQQRVSIARVLMKKPRIIFGDELTGNLDQKTAKDVMSVLLEYIDTNRATAILVTHDEKVANMCNQSLKLENQTLRKF